MSLQIILIIVGCIVIASVYISAKISSKRNAERSLEKPQPNARNYETDATSGEESNLSDEEQNSYSQLHLPISAEQKQLGLFESTQKIVKSSSEEAEILEEELAGLDENQTLVKIYIQPKKGEMFEGPDLLRALNHVGMSYGLMNIFHKVVQVEEKKNHMLFSAANMFEPGTFNLQAIEAERSKGLVFFMHIPTVLDDGIALEKFLNAAKQVSYTLGGQLYKNPSDILDNDYLDALRLKTNFIVENE